MYQQILKFLQNIWGNLLGNPVISQSLQIMWKGMLGIFVALIVIMIFVWIMAKIGNKKK